MQDLVARLTANGTTGTATATALGSWLDRWLAAFRQDLGPLAGQIVRVFERLGQVVDVTPGPVLLFRAEAPIERASGDAAAQAPDPAHEAFDAFAAALKVQHDAGHAVLVSPALHRALSGLDRSALPALHALMVDRKRLDLPRLLDDLKHDVRADRPNGHATVHKALQWLLKDADGNSFEAAHGLLDALSDILGETCLRELQRQRCLQDVLDAPPSDHAWWTGLNACFSGFGHPLSDRVSVLRCGPDHRSELAVMDHRRQRIFAIRQGPAATRDKPWRGALIDGPEAGRHHRVGEAGVVLPLRVHDAAQGLATWSVDRRLVQESPMLVGPGGSAMRAWDTGGRRAAVAVFFVHYRDSDAGEYFELGLGAFVSPQDDPLSVGLAMLGSMLVSTQRATEIGRTIWGYPKEHVDSWRWTVRYRADHLACEVRLDGATLRLRLPRSSTGFASSMPLPSYTRRPAGNRGVWHRSTLMRCSQGDALRMAGGRVELSVEPADHTAAFSHPLVSELYRLGLIDAKGHPRSQAQHAVWSEHVSGHLGPPLPVPEPVAACD